MKFVSAGHPGLLHAPAGSELALFVPGYPIGCVEGADYQERVLQLRQGDRLLLYSDGLTEAISSSGEQFGQERLQRTGCAEKEMGNPSKHARSGFSAKCCNGRAMIPRMTCRCWPLRSDEAASKGLESMQ